MRDTELLLKISKVPNDTNGELTKVNKRIDDIGVSTNGPIVGSKKNTVEVTSSTNRVAIGIPEFVKTRDVLLVYVNSVFVEEGSDYRISANGDYIEKIEGNWAVNGPKTFNFIALMNLPGLAGGENAGVMYGVKVGHKHKRTYVASATREVAIGIPEYSRHKDVIEVHVNGVYLAEGSDYTVSTDSTKIVKVNGSWSDCVVNVSVLLNSLISEEGNLIHGSLIIDKTVTENKLSQDVVDKLNRKSTSTYLANSSDILIANWIGPNSDGMYTSNVAHGLNSSKLLVSAIDTDSKRSVLISFKILDGNTIQLESDAKRNVSVSVINMTEATISEITNNGNVTNIQVDSTGWAQDGVMKKKRITHNLNTRNILMNSVDRASGMNLTMSYKVIDENTIELRSDVASECDIIIAYKSINTTNISTPSLELVFQENIKLKEQMSIMSSQIDDMNDKILTLVNNIDNR